MYKLILLLKKTDDNNPKSTFCELLPSKLKDFHNKIFTGKVESSVLLDKQFEFYIEIVTNTKEEMDNLFASKDGKEINRILETISPFVTPLLINIEE